MMDVGNSHLVTISCTDHGQHVAMALRNLFDSKRGTDFDFRLGEKSVRAHRLIVELFLAPDFNATVQDEQSVPLEVKQEVLDDVYGSGRNILDIVLEFLYKGEVAVPEEHLEELLEVAKELDFQILIDAVQVCRPVDIITENELNDDTNSDILSCEIEELLEPQFEDVKYNRETFNNTEMLHPNMNHEAIVKPKYPKLEPDDGLEDPMSGSDEYMGPALVDSDNDKDVDSGDTYDNQLYPGTLSDPCNNETVECENSGRSQHRFETPKHSKLENHPLTIHGLTSQGELAPKHKCPNCEFETSNDSGYRSHCMFIHHLTMRGEPVPLHKCPECDYSTVYSNSMKLHQSTKHTQEKIHVCPQCSYAGKLKSCLKRHLFVAHGVGGSRFTCQVCGKRCVSQSALELHSTSHTADHPFKCGFCDFAAKHVYSLKRHLNIIHGEGESRFTCKVCRKRCPTDATLEIHSRIHGDKRPFKCPHCNYTTSQLHNLNKHLKIHDEGDFPFSCEVCGRRCLSRSALERHIRTHTSERPFKCLYCSFESKHDCSLKRHIRNAHS